MKKRSQMTGPLTLIWQNQILVAFPPLQKQPCHLFLILISPAVILKVLSTLNLVEKQWNISRKKSKVQVFFPLHSCALYLLCMVLRTPWLACSEHFWFINELNVIWMCVCYWLFEWVVFAVDCVVSRSGSQIFAVIWWLGFTLMGLFMVHWAWNIRL